MPPSPSTRSDEASIPTTGTRDELQVGVLLTSGDARPRPPGVLRSVRATTWRSLLKIKHTPEQMFDVTLFPVVMVLMFSLLFGGALAGSTGDYVQFVLPGLMTMSVLMTTLYTGATVNLDMRTGVTDRLRTLPMWRPAPMVGYLVADLARYLMASIVMIAVGMVLGYRPEGGVSGVIAGVSVLLIFAFAFSWIWTALGILARSEKSVMSIGMGVLFPLTFVSNILVDPQTMPGWLSSVVEMSPVSHLVTAVRGLLGGVLEPAALAWTSGYVIAMTLVFGSLTVWAYNRR